MANNILFGTICLAVSRYKVDVGTVFEAANIVAIPPLASDRRDLNKLATITVTPTSVLPERGQTRASGVRQPLDAG
jgi:hypothetical protein